MCRDKPNARPPDDPTTLWAGAHRRLGPNDIEGAVLGHVLDLHPVHLTLAELVREMTDTPDDFAARDAIEQAVQQLARIGLLHGQRNAFVAPTPATLRFAELFGG